MIKATGMVTDAAGERPVLFMCLQPANTARLVQGDPVMFEAAELGLAPLRVVLFYAADAAAARRALAPMMRAETGHHPEQLTDQRVDWRAVAADLAAAAGPPGVAGPPSLQAALRRYHAAVQREGR